MAETLGGAILISTSDWPPATIRSWPASTRRNCPKARRLLDFSLIRRLCRVAGITLGHDSRRRSLRHTLTAPAPSTLSSSGFLHPRPTASPTTRYVVCAAVSADRAACRAPLRSDPDLCHLTLPLPPAPPSPQRYDELLVHRNYQLRMACRAGVCRFGGFAAPARCAADIVLAAFYYYRSFGSTHPRRRLLGTRLSHLPPLARRCVALARFPQRWG